MNIEGYRTLIIALVGTVAQLLGIELDANSIAQSIIALMTAIGVVYFKLAANSREKILEEKLINKEITK